MTTVAVFYRIVRSDRPTILDFAPKGNGDTMQPVARVEDRELETGISAYRTFAQARRKARSYPMLGRFIAKLEIPDDASVTWARTTNSSGHYTLWGEPPELLSYVVSVVPVT